MASPTFSSNFNGDVLDYIIKESIVGNEAFDKGSVYVMEGVMEKQSIAKMVSSSLPIIAREAMPSTKSAANQAAFQRVVCQCNLGLGSASGCKNTHCIFGFILAIVPLNI